MIRLRVWDLPIRLFHWSLAISVVGSVVSVKLGAMEVHGYFGLFTLSLLLWRLVWGFLGSGPARFTSFLVSPMTTLRYLQRPWLVLGHNPLGAWSVLVLLGLVLLQAVTGWGTSDDISFDGPLVRHLSGDWVSIFGSIHLATEPLLFGLVALHVLAIVYYSRVKKKALLPAMVHGDQLFTAEQRQTLDIQKQRPASDDTGLRVKGLIAYLISLSMVLSAYYLSL